MASRTLMRHKPVFVVPGPHPGLLVKGNIDLTKRPIVRNPNGSISTVRTISFGSSINVHGKTRNVEILIPTVVGGKIISDRAAINHFYSSKQHLGMFDNVHHANAYSIRLHNWQAAYYRKYIKRG